MWQDFFTGTKDNIAHLLPNPHFELIDTCASQSRSEVGRGSGVGRGCRARLQRDSSRTAQLQRATTTVPATINMPDLPPAIDCFPQTLGLTCAP